MEGGGGIIEGCTEEGCRDESVFVRTDVASYSRLHDISEKEKQTYPDFNPVGFSFDVFIPLFNFGYQDTWSVNTSWKPFYQRNILGYKFTLSGGGILYIFYLLEIFFGAILTTIAIAGFTGLLRGRRNE